MQHAPLSTRCAGDCQSDRAVFGKLRGVGEQVEEDLVDLGEVRMEGADIRRAGDLQTVRMLLDQGVDHVLQIGHQCRDLERLWVELHRTRFNLGKIEDVADQGVQMIAGSHHSLDACAEIGAVQRLDLALKQTAGAENGG